MRPSSGGCCVGTAPPSRTWRCSPRSAAAPTRPPQLPGSNPDAPANAFTAAPGSYLLQLVAKSQGGMCGQTYKPRFGWNQGSAMGFVLVGA